ncbi:MAG: Rpn family recombination-promoting nuclease/putative transposase [Nostoc sp. TH1S01]|nr:Rpn family recombination-promoting nuclease/putative transposase [Nostoc sp. TH1S01]
MLGITLEETRFYQEAKAEGLEQGRKQGLEQGRKQREAELLPVIVPLLLKSGMSVEEIAQQFNVAVESVEKYR